MSVESVELAKQLVRHRGEGGRGGFPLWLRERVGRYVVRRRGEGAGFDLLAEELGVARTTLLRWSQALSLPGAGAGGFSEVVVTPVKSVAGEAADAEQGASGLLQVLSPHGFSVHGLTLEQALHALSVLR